MSKPRTAARWSRGTAMIVLVALVAGCGTGQDSGGAGEGSDATWPEGSVEVVLPVAAGGTLDANTRGLQPQLEDELGVPLEITYREGGGATIGHTDVVNRGGACDPVMVTGMPNLALSYKLQDTAYTYDDFAPIAQWVDEPYGLRVANDAPWDSLEELISDAEERPGEISVSVAILTDASNAAAIALQDATGAELNVVPFGGGGPARTALVAGEVDVTISGLYDGLPIDADSRVLAVFQDANPRPELFDDAPTVNEALGTSIDNFGADYGLFATRECAEEHPERYDRLVDATMAALNSEEYTASLGDLADRMAVRPPEEYDATIQEQIGVYDDLLKRYPELFEGE